MALVMAEGTSARQRLILAGIAGNVMEWYDFAVYGYFAAIIGRQFFPANEAISSLLASFGAFAAGYVMRPFGSVVFGYIGDRFGRKAALTSSMLAMAVPTPLLGLLPTAAQVGIAAPILLVLMRLVQGLSVGGEIGTSMIFLVEHARRGHRGLSGSWTPFGATAGILIGSAVAAIITSCFSTEAVNAWAWRIPFIFGLAIGVAGLQIRSRLIEAPAPAEADPPHSPVAEAFRTEWRSIARIAGLNLVNAVGFYMSLVYVTTYLRQIDHLSASTALDINTFAMVVLLLLVPVMGGLSDRIGRKPLLYFSSVGVVLLSWPLFWLLHHPVPLLALSGQIGFALLISGVLAAGPATMVEMLPRRIRCSALSIGFNLCLAAFGGTTPLVAIYAVTHTNDDLSPAFYLMAAGAVSLLVTLTLRETYRSPLR
jgi:MHS family proline/betaine transporter-like MFS transporter